MKKIYACRPRGAQHIAVQKGCKKAFTLAELLTAVLVISVIMVALAPVITKRMKDNISVTTDNKKGLEIFTNPGTYTFDVPIGINTLFIQGAGGGGGGAGSTYVEKEKTFTSSTTWTVPTGVNEITLAITGAGGGGGGANALPNANPTNGACRQDEFLAIRGNSDEQDLCITKRNISKQDIGQVDTPAGQSCGTEFCCWTTGGHDCTAGNGNYSGCARKVCAPGTDICRYYNPANFVVDANYVYYSGIPNDIVFQKLKKYFYEWSGNAGVNGLQLCHSCWAPYNNYNDGTNFPSSVPKCCNEWGYCKSPLNTDARCSPGVLLGVGKNYDLNASLNLSAANNSVNVAYGVSARCTKPYVRYSSRYSGSGGSSGAVLEKTINVLPNDTFEITIGQGGAGGASKTKGSQGGTTKIVHKRKNIELGTYYVKGGLGGNAATTSAHGSAYSNNTTSSGTTPSGTCYSRNRKDTSDSFTGGNTSCTTISYSGESGSSTKGGNGGRVKNTGTINNGEASSGGYLYVDSSRTANQRATNEEIRLAKGQNASTPGFGGGGGLTPAWANSTSHFYQGGKGANGKVEITYKVALPGGGGGSSARVAGVDNNNKAYEIIYKVSEGDRIVFKVGSGGSGGVENQDGLNGSATVVGDNDIVFLAGEGGKTATDTDKNNLKGGRGGYTSYINEEDNIQSNIQTGIKLKSKTPPITYTINPPNNSFKGQNGTRGGVPEADTIQSGYTITNTIFSYGFNGGMGASPFNVEKSKTAASISCGGGIQGTLGQTTNLKYLCTSGNTKGNDARNHDPVNNEFGGSGGGGGGVKDDSFEQGTGGNGSSGYLRIRWDASEQE